METMRFDAEIVHRPEGTYVATCAATPGCRGTGLTPRSALHALQKVVQNFLAPALKHCSGVEVSVVVVASGLHASPPSERKSASIRVGSMERNVQRCASPLSS